MNFFSLSLDNVDMGGLVCMCMIAITLMMIYGAIKGRPSHLLPFFCLQLFDFAITTLTAAGYLCYLRSVHRLIAESHRLPWRDELLKLSPQTLSIVVLLAFVSVVLIKAYAIGIVWRCYKYLTMRQHNLRSMLPYIIPDVSSMRQVNIYSLIFDLNFFINFCFFFLLLKERDYSSLLPDYEEAIAQSMKQQPPPPSYTVAMSNAPTTPLHTVETTTQQTSAVVEETAVVPSTCVSPPPYLQPEENQQQNNVVVADVVTVNATPKTEN